jgi:cytochrome c biogenesis protein CcmG/thiol:disulfide interchange protein DsbE
VRVSTTRLLLTLPLVGFLALAAVFAFRVTDGKDRSVVPSALVGQQVPAETFPALLNDMPGVDPARLTGQVSLVNVFASWCAPCRVEHPKLMELSRRPELQIVGLNYKDRVPAARSFLVELGNPYDAVGVDPEGRKSIEWGVYGVPETFIVDAEGVIRGKHVGPITDETMAGDFGDTLRSVLDGRGAAPQS